MLLYSVTGFAGLLVYIDWQQRLGFSVLIISDNDLEEIAFVTSVEGEETLEEIPFVTSLDDVAESEATDEALTEETPLNESLLTGLDSSSVTFESGVFTVGQTGEVSVDFLFDGGGYEGELAVFSLEGMEEFGFMLVPNSTVQRVFDNPDVGGAAHPLFSMATANPDDGFHVGQIADVTGDGSTFVMEDMRVDTKSDGDYNDVIFQVRGATGEAALMDEVIDSGKDWRDLELGQEIIDYALPEPVEVDFEFPESDQPLIGVIDTGFSEDNPDIDYNRVSLGQDRIDGDNNPLIEAGEGNEHGTHLLGIIGATQDNDIGVEGINDDAPIWVGRAVGSGKWAESLVEFVDAAQESGQPNAVVNLSLDLTQIDANGEVLTRYPAFLTKGAIANSINLTRQGFKPIYSPPVAQNSVLRLQASE
ncbi:MAG: DUF4114 domain-containing protein [Coleofasciculus sp. G3-WIS-01]|uniref:DUF4114 domain-containing protein n=1 Tax=Coleofasciculus sp. G3-WIS-01 TaxID=3069528 RepID=UPI0032F37146